MAERLNLCLYLSSRTLDPTAETWDLKEMPSANHPVPGFPSN
jgi:hypothetical protein